MPGPPSPAAFLSAFADRLDSLAERSLRPWLDVGLDPRGGAYGFLDRTFTPRFDAHGPSGERRGDQSLVQQARHLFAYSFFHARRPGNVRVEAMAQALYAHLMAAFPRSAMGHNARTSPESPSALTRASLVAPERRSSDLPPSSSGGVHLTRPLLHWIPRGGLESERALRAALDFEVTDPTQAVATQLYAQAFAIYALCTYGLAFGKKTPVRQAWELFVLMDAMRHDDAFGGYDQTTDGGWLCFVSAPPGAAKCTNTHIHLLEALTPLCRCLPHDDLVVARLLELARFISTTMLQPSGYVHKFFARDGAPIGAAEVSYGHDLETSWLLLDALDVLDGAGRLDHETRDLVEGASRRMAEHALRTGWDDVGGVFDSGVPEGTSKAACVTIRDKIWWAQAEALPGIFRLYLQTRDESLLGRLAQTLDFVVEKCWDPDGGEFFWGVDSQGNCLHRGDHKGEFWKTPYHALRACVLTADWCRQEVERLGQ